MLHEFEHPCPPTIISNSGLNVCFWPKADIVQIAVQADVRERIAQLGLEVSLNSPEEFAVVIKSDTAKWAKVIRAANIKAE